jgi:uncharacterized membrane protein YiaA
MPDKKRSIMSKGWLIVGIVLFLIGIYLIFLAISLFSESYLIREGISNGENYKIIIESANNISVNALFLTITSLIIMAIGIIMCLEWISFSKFLKDQTEI